MPHKGIGVEANPAQGIQMLTKAADEGFGLAAYTLGNFYYKGKHITRDYVKAIHWLVKVTRKNYANIYGRVTMNDECRALKMLEEMQSMERANKRFKFSPYL